MHIEVILERTEGEILSNYYRYIEKLVIKQETKHIQPATFKSLSVIFIKQKTYLTKTFVVLMLCTFIY